MWLRLEEREPLVSWFTDASDGAIGNLLNVRGRLNVEIEFYNVKTKSKVQVPVADVQCETMTQEKKNGSSQTRYVLRAVYSGTKLLKFVSQTDWEKVKATKTP